MKAIKKRTKEQAKMLKHFFVRDKSIQNRTTTKYEIKKQKLIICCEEVGGFFFYSGDGYTNFKRQRNIHI